MNIPSSFNTTRKSYLMIAILLHDAQNYTLKLVASTESMWTNYTPAAGRPPIYRSRVLLIRALEKCIRNGIVPVPF